MDHVPGPSRAELVGRAGSPCANLLRPVPPCHRSAPRRRRWPLRLHEALPRFSRVVRHSYPPLVGIRHAARGLDAPGKTNRRGNCTSLNGTGRAGFLCGQRRCCMSHEIESRSQRAA